MKTLTLFLLVLLNGSLTGQHLKRASINGAISKDSLTIADAEKILGKAARLTAQFVEEKNGIIKYNATYTAIDEKSGQKNSEENLYYLCAQYKNREAAHTAYADIIKANHAMPGQSAIPGLGDEAFFHTDNQHFYLVIFRKADKIITLKVNKIGPKTSADQLKRVAFACI